MEDRLAARMSTDKARTKTDLKRSFLPADGIDRKVLEAQLSSLIPGARFQKSGQNEGREGYFIDLPETVD